ncbi:amyloid protein-binding protein 2 isoform X2 [Rhopalosiphum padi]|uniref:amyloid protein-binding protein 2 isoform X2 n=1 Tax=Rhopalosiphum padi TaxID=40932 RepID=UPI00298E9AA9|nr:amyloid protein-binding protein 2 isoform X2 [Rhopalosiphum padi]
MQHCNYTQRRIRKIIMSNSSPNVESLYNKSLNQLCYSMNEDILLNVMKWLPPSISLQIVWKVLRVNDGSEKFIYNHMLPDSELSSINRGREIAQMSLHNSGYTAPVSYRQMSSETHEGFATIQQTKFVDHFNFSNHFDLNLFSKFVDVTNYRSELFTIFQICVQMNGFQFPKQLADEWIKIDIQDNNDNVYVHHIDQGLKLGIFLGDAGWFSECALVLSHTYQIITTKWVCHDQNLKLVKIIQCLTKWLLVVSNYHNFDEAKVVLQHMLQTIGIIEKLEERTLCIAYAYVAVSQYYYVLMEFNEAWSWAVKAVYELRDKSADILKLLVISHAVRVCSVLNKLSTARKLLNQLHTYEKEIDQNIHVDMLLNEACYSLKADLAKDSINSYYIALDSRRNLFGYYNLHTAIVFVDYAYARYVCDYSTTDFNEAMRSILQGIFIMEKIGLPNDNMLLVNAGRIKALILEEKALDIMDRDLQADGIKRLLERMKKNMLNEAEALHLKALQVSLQAVGVKALLTAKSYCNLGRLYQSQEKFTQSEKMHLKAIEIKESILGKDNPEVALSLGHLASLYTYQLKKYEEAEVLYLRSKTIYETTYGRQYTGLLYDFQGLVEVYRELNNTEKYNQYTENILRFHETREAWLHEVHTATDENCTKDDLSLEKFKCILNECACDK